MKRVLLTILLCWVSLGYSADVRFISNNTGNDSNSGVDFANAWLTLGKAVTDGQAAGDTVVAVGTFTETVVQTASGTQGNQIVWIDSLRYIDGINSTKPDTFWTATIDGGATRGDCISSQGDDFTTWIGFHLTDPTTNNWDHDFSSNNDTLWQMKFTNSGNTMVNSEGKFFAVISCLFIGTTGNNFRLFRNSNNFTEDTYVVNNTFYSDQDIDHSLQFDQINSDENITFRNNLIHRDDSRVGSFHAIQFTSALVVGVVGDFNNNIFYGPNMSNWFEFNGTDGNTIAAWEDSVNNYDGDGATNSLNTAPALQAVTTTAFILNTSAAAEAGVDLGFGNDIGYYQTDPSVTRSRFIGID